MRFFILIVFLLCAAKVYAMPTQGAVLPDKGSWAQGLEVNFLFEKEMKHPKGKVDSRQYFTMLSYAPSDWFCFDFRAGSGNLKFEENSNGTINYNTAFAGGYGFRARLTQANRSFMDILYGFQHISVHPDPRRVDGIKNEISMDDWQASVICAKKINFLYPYAAVKYSRVNLTRITSESKDRKISGSIDRVGFAAGIDFIINKYINANLEGRFFDEKGFSVNLSWRF